MNDEDHPGSGRGTILLIRQQETVLSLTTLLHLRGDEILIL